MPAAIFSALHLIALGIGLGAVWIRARALRAPTWDAAAIRRVLVADNVWGIAAILWFSTGFIRAFSGLERGSDFYLHNGFFWVKMGAIAILLAFEAWPMIALIGWRRARAAGGVPDTSRVLLFARASEIEAGLVIIIVFAAAMMARGVWLFP